MKVLAASIFALIMTDALGAIAQDGSVTSETIAPVTATSETTSSTAVSSYPTNLKMRDDRKVGAGTQVGGVTGLAGLHVELNFEDDNSGWAGFGFGPGYSAFALSWRHHFEGQYITPYTDVGWARWYNSSGNRRPESYLLDATLHEDEKASGRFGIDYVMAGGGLQYNQLDGDFAGTSFFAQVDMLLPPFRGGVMPTAAIGMTYFF